MIAKDCTERLCRCLLHRPHYSARLVRFGSHDPSEFFFSIRHRNACTEIAWEDAQQGLGMASLIMVIIRFSCWGPKKIHIGLE